MRGRGALREAPGHSEVKQRSPSPIKYGMDAAHEERVSFLHSIPKMFESLTQ